MKLNIMREFVRLAATRNYTRAAEELFIAQPVLSRHMAALEAELGVRLIDRSRNSFALTNMGEIVLEDFQNILECYPNMLDELSRQTKIDGGELHLGFLYYDKDFYIAKIRETFLRKFPDVQLILQSYQPMQMEEDLLDGKLDAAIVYGAAECNRRDVETLPFLKIPYCLIYPKAHRLSFLKDVQISDLDGEKLLQPERDFEINHAGDTMIHMLREGGARITEQIKVHNYDEVPWIMQETGAIYISPMVNPGAYGSDTEYRFLLPELYRCDVSLVWLAQNQNPAVPLLRAAVKMCYP